MSTISRVSYLDLNDLHAGQRVYVTIISEKDVPQRERQYILSWAMPKLDPETPLGTYMSVTVTCTPYDCPPLWSRRLLMPCQYEANEEIIISGPTPNIVGIVVTIEVTPPSTS